MRKALLVVAALMVAPRAAYPCMNAVRLRGDKAVQRLVAIEAEIDRGKLDQALSLLQETYIEDERLTDRLVDIHRLIELRLREMPKPAQLVTYFKERAESPEGKKSVRIKAWLAEAYAFAGEKPLALAILTDLKKRDLMPDAHAFRILAELSDGNERVAALAACKTRAKAKSICVLAPAKNS